MLHFQKVVWENREKVMTIARPKGTVGLFFEMKISVINTFWVNEDEFTAQYQPQMK